MRSIRSHTSLALCALVLAALAACSGDAAPACTDGAPGCACRVDDTCDDGLVCDLAARQCEATHEVDLPAIDPAARSCEVLVEDDGARAVSAAFDDSVVGEVVRQAPRTAIAFHATDDAAVATGAVRVVLAGSGDMTVVRARCFDHDGRAIPGGGLRGATP